MNDPIFEEFHEFHKKMWDFISNDPEKDKEDYLYCHADFPRKFRSLIWSNSSCFACTYAKIIQSELDDQSKLFCCYCPITIWREFAKKTDGHVDEHDIPLMPCIDMANSPFEAFEAIHYEDEEITSNLAAIIRDMEWSVDKEHQI